MKTYTKILIAFLVLCGISALAQITNTNIVPLPDPSTVPTSLGDYWDLAIAGVTPLLVWGLSKLAPKVPRVLLPFSAAILGIGLGLGLNALGLAHLTWYDGMKAGALAIGIREMWNQAIGKRLADNSPV